MMTTNGPLLKVRIGKSLGQITVRGENISRTFHPNNTFKIYKGPKKIKFNCDSLYQGMSRADNHPILLASMSSLTGPMFWNYDPYHGKFHLISVPKKKKCDLVQELSMESYLGSLLSKEVSSSWPVEVLKAQAVAARTYALHKLEESELKSDLNESSYFDLENSEKHQVNGSLQDITKKTLNAAMDTKGMILVTKQGSHLTPIFFHASCGGKTLRPNEVWENNVPGYESVSCEKCTDTMVEKWNNEISIVNFKNFLSWVAKERKVDSMATDIKNKEIMIAPDRKQNHVLRIYLGSNVYVINKTLLRRYFGRVKIRSNNFRLQYDDKKISLQGNGHGHGVGMCQIGALDLARKGWDYKKILAHYFPGHKLKKVY